jgi:hypothetical protein
MPAGQDGKNGIREMDLKRLDLFVFDTKGTLVKEYADSSPILSPSYYMPLPDLKPGQYRIVAWGTLGKEYAVAPAGSQEVDKSNINNLLTVLTTTDEPETAGMLPPLFYAAHTAADSVTILPLTPNDIHLNLLEDTYILNFEGAGLDSMNALGFTYKIYIEDNNGKYKFDNDFAPCPNFNYTTVLKVKETEKYTLAASIRVLRLSRDRKNATVKLKNETLNADILSANLTDLLLAAQKQGDTQLDFDTQHVFDIRFDFDTNSPLSCTVFINGYKVTDHTGIILN